MRNFLNIIAISLTLKSAMVISEPEKKAFFGDTHLHSSYSFDAFLNNNHSADPDTAYRFAKGQPVIHPFNRTRVQINTPLDFLVVSDHAEMLGVMRAVREDKFIETDLGLLGNVERWYAFRLINDAIDNNTGLAFFRRFLPQSPVIKNHSDPVKNRSNDLSGLNAFGDMRPTSEAAWDDIVESAERHNDPGKFTSFLGWEWSSIPLGANLHRIVITPDGAEKGKQFLPYGSDQSQYPEDLWEWLDQTSERTGARFIAIPHNSNISKGYMFDDTSLRGEPINADYARRRIKWEPVVEVTQIKGDSETRSDFSPEDEFADFENYDHYIQVGRSNYVASSADYIRPALKKGIAIQQSVGVNPYKFGLIGSTDAHTGLSTSEENNFWGKMAADSTPETKQRLGNSLGANGWNMSASGLAAVWAEDNTREAIFAAFKRKETYATSGPRIRLQIFGGWEFPDKAVSSPHFAEIASQYGVPMGGDLAVTDDIQKAPVFLMWAVKDPVEANLDRLQIVKGWVAIDGIQHEKIYDVVWSGDRVLDKYGKLPSVGNTVDLVSGRYTNSIGAAELSAKWTDPDFNPQQPAFYYVRVLQIPTPRNGFLDGLALQLAKPPRGPKTIQERAYSSPIWYQPD